MSLLGPKRWLDNRLGPSRLGLFEDDDRRLKGRFRVKQLTDICLAPTVIVSVVAHQPSPQSSPLLRVPLLIKRQDLGGGICTNPDLSNLPISEKTHKKTAITEAEASTMTVGKVAGD